jgi:hypothetical protein
MLAAHKAGVANTQKSLWTDAALNSWISVYAIAAVAKKISGPINNATFLHALHSAKKIDTQGLTAPWNPNRAGPTGQYKRISNTDEYYFKGVGTAGQIQLEYQKAFDIAKLLP